MWQVELHVKSKMNSVPSDLSLKECKRNPVGSVILTVSSTVAKMSMSRDADNLCFTAERRKVMVNNKGDIKENQVYII